MKTSSIKADVIGQIHFNMMQIDVNFTNSPSSLSCAMGPFNPLEFIPLSSFDLPSVATIRTFLLAGRAVRVINASIQYNALVRCVYDPS